MEKSARMMLDSAVEKFHISMRTYSRISKVARTIADLGGHEKHSTPGHRRGDPPQESSTAAIGGSMKLYEKTALPCVAVLCGDHGG